MPLTTNTKSSSMGVANRTMGQVVTDSGTAVDTTFTPGFTPRYVAFHNLTDRISLEWYEGMAANSAIRTVAAGTRTLDVSSGITLGSKAAGTEGSFTVKAADIPASKTCAWVAEG